MTWRVYPFLRGLHLYAGLFVSPFVLLFAGSVFFLVHAWIPGTAAVPRTRSVGSLVVAAGVERLQGREQVDAARALLDQIGVKGEIGSVRYFPADHRWGISVAVPGADTNVEVNLRTASANVTTRETGVWDALVYLHKMPGPHNVRLRGNSAGMAVWRWLADATVWLILFSTVSGVYLWVVLRAERRVGLVFLAAGAISFGSLVYVLTG